MSRFITWLDGALWRWILVYAVLVAMLAAALSFTLEDAGVLKRISE